MMALSQSVIQQRLRLFPSMCRAASLKVTQQREMVYSALASVNLHPTAEEVHQSIDCAQEESPSLGTVYKILDVLCSRQIIRKVPTKGQAARYDANCAPHQHVHCVACDGLFDVEIEVEQVLDAAPHEQFKIHDVQIVYQGTCAHCQSTSHPSAVSS